MKLKLQLTSASKVLKRFLASGQIKHRKKLKRAEKPLTKRRGIMRWPHCECLDRSIDGSPWLMRHAVPNDPHRADTSPRSSSNYANKHVTLAWKLNKDRSEAAPKQSGYTARKRREVASPQGKVQVRKVKESIRKWAAINFKLAVKYNCRLNMWLWRVLIAVELVKVYVK